MNTIRVSNHFFLSLNFLMHFKVKQRLSSAMAGCHPQFHVDSDPWIQS